MGTAIATFSSGVAGPPTASGVAPNNVSGITVTGFIDPVTSAITMSIGIVPPSPIGTFIGGHIYLECPDQSANSPLTVGTSTVGGSDAVTGTWIPIDCGKQVYVATEQPWTVTVPGPPGIDPTQNIPCRVYVAPFSTSTDTPLVRATDSSPTPNQTFELISLASGSPTSGTNITTLTVASGAQVGIVATALAPDDSTGKLLTPVEVIVTDTPTTKGWCFQLVVTLGQSDPTNTTNQFIETGIFNQAGPVAAGPDGISVPHTFTIPTPTTVQTATVWLQAGLVSASGVFQGNNIVPGITPQFSFTYGSTVGTTDASAIMTATIAASMAIVNQLFGVASGGISNTLLGAGAVATINVQNLAITNPLLASLAVQSANLASGSVTSTAIAALAVGTGAIQTAAITNALIANAAISGAQIQSATITGANIASATIAGANIGTATIAQANMANASIGTAQIQNASINDAQINNLSASKITTGTITATVSMTAPNLTVTGSPFVITLNSSTGFTCTSTSGSTTYTVSIENGSGAFTGAPAIIFSGLNSGTGSITEISPGNIAFFSESFFSRTGSATLSADSGGSGRLELTADNNSTQLLLGFRNASPGVYKPALYFNGTFTSTLEDGILRFSGTQILTTQQTGLGSPSGFADSVAQSYIQNLYNKLSTHGLIT